MNLGRIIELLSNNCYYQISGTAIISVLTEVYPLPSAEVQATISNGDGDADTAQRRFGVSRHIVSTFQRMLVFWQVLRNQTVEDGFHIHTNIRVTILVDAQSATGVLCEDVHDARLRQFWQLAHNLACYQMEATTFRLQGYFYLLYHNGCKGTNKRAKYQIYLSIEEISLLYFRENPPPYYDFSFVNLKKSSELCTVIKKQNVELLKYRRHDYEEDDDPGNDDGHDYLGQRNEL